jgi:Bacterial protein of unknown function (Gcw_chp)
VSVFPRGFGCIALAAACWAAGLATLAPSPAHAQAWRGSLGIATEQVKRGIRVSSGRTAWAASVSRAVEGEGFGYGAAASGPAYPGAGGEGELRVYGSYLWQPADDRAVELTLARYQVWGDSGARQYASTELAASGAQRFGRARGLLTLRHSPDQGLFLPGAGFVRGAASGVEAEFSVGLMPDFALEAGLGWQRWRLDRTRRYAYGHLGLAWQSGAWRLSILRVSSRAQEELGVSEQRGAPRWVGIAGVSF